MSGMERLQAAERLLRDAVASAQNMGRPAVYEPYAIIGKGETSVVVSPQVAEALADWLALMANPHVEGYRNPGLAVADAVLGVES